MNVYTRRLQADWDALREALREHPQISIAATAGNPPQRYHVLYRVRGLEERPDGEVAPKGEHLAEITLLRSYPRQAPLCRMLTPVFHPNIAPHAICIGDHWSAGESLVEIVVRIGELIAFQSYNIKSPLNGEAARWVEEHLDELPIDPRPLSVAAASPTAAQAPPHSKPAARTPPIPPAPRSAPTPPAPAIAAAPTPDEIVFKCPKCLTKLSAERQHAGMEISCPGCGSGLLVPRPKAAP
jgi:ubiquitin-protein ligase/DNA-directed RNA polymerase subunit RPC12/RpoP